MQAAAESLQFLVGDHIQIKKDNAWHQAVVQDVNDWNGMIKLKYIGYSADGAWTNPKEVEVRRLVEFQSLAPGQECPADLQNLPELENVVKKIPSVEEMTEWAKQGKKMLREKLDEIDDLIYPLLMWLLTTNRAHLRPLAAREKFPDLGTPHQFVLMSGPVEKETEFQNLKRDHGSIFCWHGSAPGNWHVILRTSLKNMSGTKHMSAGQAYGAGIYFASEFATSLGYCGHGMSDGWPKSMFTSKSSAPSIKCMAMCEIIDKKEDFTYHPGKQGARSSGNRGIYVVPKEEFVVTRFFFVNPAAGRPNEPRSSAPPSSSGRSDSFEVMKEAIDSGRLGFLS